MTEINKGIYAGIIVMIIALSSGTTYYLEKTGDYKNCYDGGWVLNEDTGQYDCKSRGLTEWCFELSAVNKDGIQTRCYIGRVIHTEPDEHGDFAEKIEGSEMVRHTDTHDYEVWELKDKFNTIQVQTDIDNNQIEITKLELEYNKCKDMKDKEYIAICEQDKDMMVEQIKGEDIILEEKLDKVK